MTTGTPGQPAPHHQAPAPSASDGVKSPRAGALLLALAAFFGFLLIRYVSPVATPYLPACPVRSISGLYCPGCGTARALHALANGQFAAAADRNVFLVFFLPLLAGWLLLLFLRTVRDNQWQVPPVPSWAGIALLLALLAFGILRNLPWTWTSWLAP